MAASSRGQLIRKKGRGRTLGARRQVAPVQFSGYNLRGIPGFETPSKGWSHLDLLRAPHVYETHSSPACSDPALAALDRSRVLPCQDPAIFFARSLAVAITRWASSSENSR